MNGCNKTMKTVIFLFVISISQACPPECICQHSEVRCVIPKRSRNVLPNFSSLSKSSQNFKRLTLSHSHIQRVSFLAAFRYLRHIEQIDLSWNNISDLSSVTLSRTSEKRPFLSLNLSNNSIKHLNICDEHVAKLRHVKKLDLSHNQINRIDLSCSSRTNKPIMWEHLDLSSNRLVAIDLSEFLSHTSQLVALNLSTNFLRNFSQHVANRSRVKPKLTSLFLSSNEFSEFHIPHPIFSLREILLDNNRNLQKLCPRTFQNLLNLKSLSARDCPKLNQFDTHGIIKNLTVIDLSGCTRLRNLDLSVYYSLKEIYLSRTNLSSFLPPITWNTRQNGLLEISNTHNWNCSCDVLWVSSLARPTTALCASPKSMVGQQIPKNLSSCRRPQILNFSSETSYGLGEKARLECRVGGDPHPIVIWSTPSAVPHVYRTLTTHTYHTSDQTQGTLFHANHPWHGSHVYRHELEREKKRYYYVLTDGSLYIDYVTRTDAGKYTCTVLSPLGNQTLSMDLRLDYDILRAVKWHSLIVGMICAGCMLIIGLTVGIVKLIMRRCRSEEREKRNRTLRALLENLESYRADKFDKLRAYKSNKMDQLRDNYSGQMVRIKESCYTHMLNMQDHYNRRISKIRENYETKIEHLRDSYSGQMMRIKDYRSHQVERIRDNYSQQVLRIREYASVQLMRLRDQYRLQQQFFIKLLETLNLENCMTVDVDEFDDAITRGAEVGLGETDDDEDVVPLDCQLDDQVMDPDAILLHMNSPIGDLEAHFPLQSLPSLPRLPDLDCFVPEDFRRHRSENLMQMSGDESNEGDISPLRSASPVSEDYQTADSEYELSAILQTVVVIPENCRREVSDSSSNSAVAQVEASV